MKRFMKSIIVFLLMLSVSGCNQNDVTISKIDIKDMRAIAELATIECYFHNVAKSEEILDKAWYEVWKKDIVKFWVEYEGIVYIGVDCDKIKVAVEGDNVKITLPKANVKKSKVNELTLNKDSFYYDKNSEKPTVEQETKVFESAQHSMEEAAKENISLLESAEENAKELLENYVETIGEALGIEYTIEWVEVE